MTVEKAIWYPFWYELDQSVEVGCVDDFDFFHAPPDHLATEDMPVFYHGNWNEKDAYYTERRRILRIHHPQIGEIQRIDTRGLDYTLTLTDGTVLKVEAEETPGVVYDFHTPVEDWRVYIETELA